MIERILQFQQESDYDFRTSANPADQPAHLFPDWVPYYRMKAAIARALQPKTILEIGVRCGYSGAALLHGCPTAHYTGIDLDTDGRVGPKGALDWARRILPAGRHELLVADTRSMHRLPGGIYDLIRVDGQQDGDGTYHDLELAICQGRHVLVDGCLWTAHNFRAAGEVLRQHKDLIDYWAVIPGCAGELLIKIRESSLGAVCPPAGAPASTVIRAAYDTRYYLSDCGGWESFGETRSRDLSDPRLRCVFDLAMMRQPQRVLDLGCGRGEIAYQAAAQGCEVVAVDYSPAAIEIARSTLADAPLGIKDRVTLLCEDASRIELPTPVDVAVAGDLVEHMAPAELERLYATVARQLAPEGLFVIHTFPNKWYYDYDFPRRRRIALSVGAYLPANPRSRYERLMHINEQSPRVLRRQLLRHFPHVLLWFGSSADPAGSLGRQCSPRWLAAQQDLFALASSTPIDPTKVRSLFASGRLQAADLAKISLISAPTQLEVGHGGRGHIAVTLRNGSARALGSYRPWPIHFAYHWLKAPTREVAIFDGQRSLLVPSCSRHSSREYSPGFIAPLERGDYILQMTLVQEGVCWFNEHQVDAAIEISVKVV